MLYLALIFPLTEIAQQHPQNNPINKSTKLILTIIEILVCKRTDTTFVLFNGSNLVSNLARSAAPTYQHYRSMRMDYLCLQIRVFIFSGIYYGGV